MGTNVFLKAGLRNSDSKRSLGGYTCVISLVIVCTDVC